MCELESKYSVCLKEKAENDKIIEENKKEKIKKELDEEDENNLKEIVLEEVEKFWSAKH